MRVVASIEARMGSSRFPGKVLADLCGAPVLSRIVERLRKCTRLDDLVLATSNSPQDDLLEIWAECEGIKCFRGSEDDVLSRVVEAHVWMQSDIIVELTGDCPLTDPMVVDWGVDTFLHNDCDVVSTVRHASFPDGIDVQVFRKADLSQIEKTVHTSEVREHVSSFFYSNPKRYRIYHLVAPCRWHAPNCRLVLDYREDYACLCAIYERLKATVGDDFGLDDILSLLRKEPELTVMNRHLNERELR